MWAPLTEDVLNQVLNAGELASVTRDRAQVQPDPIPGILAETAATIRSRIASGGRTRLQGGPDCIPAELMAEAGAIIRYRVLDVYKRQGIIPCLRHRLVKNQILASGCRHVPDRPLGILRGFVVVKFQDCVQEFTGGSVQPFAIQNFPGSVPDRLHGLKMVAASRRCV